MRLPHLAGQLAGGFDLDQLALPDSRAPVSGLEPFFLVIDQFRPEREQAALGRLGGMDRTAVLAEKSALGFTRNGKSAQVGGAVDVFALEFGGREAKKQR